MWLLLSLLRLYWLFWPLPLLFFNFFPLSAFVHSLALALALPLPLLTFHSIRVTIEPNSHSIESFGFGSGGEGLFFIFILNFDLCVHSIELKCMLACVWIFCSLCMIWFVCDGKPNQATDASYCSQTFANFSSLVYTIVALAFDFFLLFCFRLILIIAFIFFTLHCLLASVYAFAH